MRIFTAIPFPESIKSALAELCKAQIPTARWVHPDDFHLTLRFIGNVDPETHQRYHNALSTIDAAPFNLCLKGIGRFPQNITSPPTVLWVDVERSPELLNLYDIVSNTLEAAGLQPDRHPNYSPHVTLARLRTKQQLSELDMFLKVHQTFELPLFEINHITLYERKPNDTGGNYTPLSIYKLGHLTD